MTDNRLRGCVRTGMCCTQFHLGFSPRQLRKMYDDWKSPSPGTTKFIDIHLIYPMLEGRCKGVVVDGPQRTYVYGPCKNFVSVNGQLPACSIHEIKPQMCRDYPFYDRAQPIRMSTDEPLNPVKYRGCGYNSDPNFGELLEGLHKGLQPLTADDLPLPPEDLKLGSHNLGLVEAKPKPTLVEEKPS